MIVALLFFIAIFAINVITYLGIATLGQGICTGTVIFFGLWVIFAMFIFDMVVIWKITVNKDVIIYRNFLGIKRTYNFKELDKIIEKKNSDLIVYQNNKRIFSIDNNLIMGIFFEMSARDYNVIVESEKTQAIQKAESQNNGYIVRPAKYMRILSIICFIVFIGFLVFCLYFESLTGILGFGCFTIFGIFNVIYHYTEKYVIGKKDMTVYKLFKKPFTVLYSDITKVDHAKDSSTTYFVFYIKDRKRPLKINTYYENAFMIEDLIAKKLYRVRKGK